MARTRGWRLPSLSSHWSISENLRRRCDFLQILSADFGGTTPSLNIDESRVSLLLELS